MLVDIPGTYSIMSNSEEEEIARDYICFGHSDCVVVVIDATCLERNLNLVYQILEITNKVVVCVNLIDEAKKKGIFVDLDRLSDLLGVSVVGTIARKKKTLNNLMDAILNVCNNTKENTKSQNYSNVFYGDIIEKSISIIENSVKTTYPNIFNNNYRWISLKLLEGNHEIIKSIEKHLKIELLNNNFITRAIEHSYDFLLENGINLNMLKNEIVSTILFKSENTADLVLDYSNINYDKKSIKIDKILTSKLTGIPIMILFFLLIFWITIIGSNYPSKILSNFFNFLENKLIIVFKYFNSPDWLIGVLVFGMYRTLAWVVSVMLPPMAIFFPLFTILEDLGYLPRIAFNLDGIFRKDSTSGKQALTMCMGFGCNSAGVVGCRIIESPKEKLIATLTNSFVPCNGRFPFLITISTIFITGLFCSINASIISTICVTLLILLGVFMTFIVSKILSKTLLKGIPSSFVLELPPFRKPQFGKIVVRSIFDRTLFVLRKSNCYSNSCRNNYMDFCKYIYWKFKYFRIYCKFLKPICKTNGTRRIYFSCIYISTSCK